MTTVADDDQASAGVVPAGSPVVVCSFYTDDDYYRAHADRLRANLDRLGLTHRLEEVHKPDGADWADLCRRKVPFLWQACQEFPESRVFWIDVDCALVDLPAYVRDSTADLVGFARGFAPPQNIGYGSYARFWEPCFLGIAATPAGRKYIARAAELEAASDLKATDDYFFEEAWRGTGPEMTFQLIPSTASMSKADPDSLVTPFFLFGSSGKVGEFKGKVAQHDQASQRSAAAATGRERVRRRLRNGAKRLESALPRDVSSTLRRHADRSGVTHLLTQRLGVAPRTDPNVALTSGLLRAAQHGDTDQVAAMVEVLEGTGALSTATSGAIAGAKAFLAYRQPLADTPGAHDRPVPLVWWARPLPGNFGDWLSPLLVRGVLHRPVEYVPPTRVGSAPNLMAVGSIARFAQAGSVVVGSGLSTSDHDIHPRATIVSLRGPLTAQVVQRADGRVVESFGDPGALLRRVVPVHRGETNGKIALVRHFTHAQVPISLPESMDELSVLVSHPEDIERFVRRLSSYDAVVTSAMHVLVACQSYGIPCALVTFEGLETSVHGNGMKYSDYARGIGLGTDLVPTPVGFDLGAVTVDDMLTQVRISDEKLDEIEHAVRMAGELFDATSE